MNAQGSFVYNTRLVASREAFQKHFDVSRETISKFDIYQALLSEWSSIMNLVAPSTLPDLWMRHFGDSAQLLEIALASRAPARMWLDMGAGAGFPGLVIAILLADVAGSKVLLIESDHRKCAFLRAVSRETGARAEVVNDRIEAVIDALPTLDCVTARALAPLDVLIDYAQPVLQKGTLGIFPKGQHLADELTKLTRFSSVSVEIVPSRTDPNGKIALVRSNFLATEQSA